MTGTETAREIAAGEHHVEAGLRAVAVHAGEEDFAGAEFDAALRPGEGVEMGGVASAANADVPVIDRHRFRIDGQRPRLVHRIRAKVR